MARVSVLLFCGALLLAAATHSSAAPTTPNAAPPSLAPASTPAPAPAPHYVNLTNLFTVAGPFHTFLSYLVQTNVIETFQNQANNTNQGITIFVPTDTAFAALKKPSLANLTQDQLKSLMLYHALPNYYSLAEFGSLSQRNPVGTFAGGQYTLNFSDASGLIRVDSGWSNPKISSSVFSTRPVAVYEVEKVLLPVAIFGVAPPPPPPAPAPAPEAAKPSDTSPSAKGGGSAGSPQSETPANSATTDRAQFDAIARSIVTISGGIVLLLL